MLDFEHNSGPLDPAQYDSLNDPYFTDLRDYVVDAGASSDPEWHHARISELLSRFPIQRLLTHLNEEQAVGHVRAVLGTYVRDQIKLYLEGQGADPRTFPELPAETELHLSLQWCGDRLTGEHLANAAVVVGFTTDIIDGYMGLSDEEGRRLNVLAGATHDFGKAALPRFVLENPVPRGLMAVVYAWNLGDPNRKRPVESPIPLDEAEQARFMPLLAGETFAPDLIMEFAQLCKERKGDYLSVTPIRTLIKLSEYVLKHGVLPPVVQEYVDALTNPNDKAAVEHMIQTIQGQKDLVFDSNWALARSGFDGFQPLMKVLAGHEYQSFKMAPPCVSSLVARHHRFPETRDRLVSERRFDLEPDPYKVQALIIADVICALSEHRPYFADGQPKPLNVIRKIVFQEAVQRHRLPEAIVRRVIAGLLSGEEDKEPLKKIIESGRYFDAE